MVRSEFELTFDDRFFEDPAGTLEAACSEGIHRAHGLVWIGSYEAIVMLLRDRRLVSDVRAERDSPPADFLHMDGPMHRKIRELVHSGLRQTLPPGRAARLIARSLTASLDGPTDNFNLVTGAVEPAVAAVLDELFGMRGGSVDLLPSVRQLTAALELVEASEDERTAGRTAGLRLLEFFAGTVDELARESQLVRHLRDAHSQGDLDELQMLSSLVVVLHGAFENTANFISMAALAMAADDPLRPADSASVESLLASCSPAQLVVRRATEDINVTGHAIERGEVVALVLANANRMRSPSIGRHLAFGYGAHYCPGATLAREESLSALRTLRSICPRIDRESASWRRQVVFRGLGALAIGDPEGGG